MIILYSDAPRGKRKRKEEECSQTVPAALPAGKRMKRAVNRPKRTRPGQEKAAEPGQSTHCKTSADSCAVLSLRKCDCIASFIAKNVDL